MAAKHNLDCFDEFTSRFIRGKVRRLIGKAGFTESDRPDLIQDFALDLIRRREKFNPEAANWEAFVVVVCENRFASLLEHRRAQKRSRDREGGSLSRSIRDGEGKPTEVGATLPDTQSELRTGQHHRSPEDAADLVQDVAGLLAQVPPQLRELCKGLEKKSVSSVAKEMGMSRASIYTLIRDLRTRFERSGLRDYLR